MTPSAGAGDLRLAIISFEHMHAWSYAAALTAGIEGARLTAVADYDAERLERARRDCPTVEGFYADWRALLDHSDVDGVVICSANCDHAEIAVECARRGKHILCEKPLAITIDDCRAIIAAAREGGVKLMTAFPVRFSPAIAEAKRLIEGGNLGQILGACTSNHGSMPGSWFVEREKSGGGAVIDHTVHVVDVLRYIFEDEVESIYAEYDTRLHDLKVEDVGQLLMRFRNGAVVSLDTSWTRPKSYPIWGDVKIDLKAENANVSINCFPRQMNHYDDRTMRHSGTSPGEDLDALMLEEFTACIRENREPLVTGEDGMRAVEVALAAYKAGEQKQAVQVELAAV